MKNLQKIIMLSHYFVSNLDALVDLRELLTELLLESVATGSE
jgi:RNAse (barnase) inhibitor barstar